MRATAEARVGLLWFVLFLGVACAPVRPVPTPLASYVLLGESPQGEAAAFARVIVPAGSGCPELHGRGAALAMRKRQNSHGFEVDVCEATLAFGEPYTLGRGGVALPVAKREVRRVAVMGDTGCKPNEQQDCGLDDPAWAFPTLVRAAAARRPELVIHVGDYNYRGTPSSFEPTLNGQTVKQWYYDAGDGAEPTERCELPGPYYSQNSTGNVDRDSWQAWWLDFFQPAADLLAAAPWVLARGNHELCSHAGPGWFYFLDASSELPEGGGAQLSCPPQDGEGPALPHLAFVPPRVVHLEGLSLAVLDAANACDELPNFTDLYAGQLEALGARLRGRPAWFVSHRPVWGVEGAADGPVYGCDGAPEAPPSPPATYGVLNRTLQCAFAEPPGRALLPRLDLLLHGHMHRFEALHFPEGSGRPPTLIIGNSGVAEDTDPPQGAFTQSVDGSAASGISVEQFGFLELSRETGGAWRGTILTPNPAAWAPEFELCSARETLWPALCVEGLGR